jgi:succinate dehydrogenase / fumarate reductase flavoprotein subunit
MIKHDVLVVGGGLAGLRAAIEAFDAGRACPAGDVAVISQVHPLRSHSGAAQGGINAALANAEDGRDDSPERHAYDTAKGSDFLADQDAVEIMTLEGLDRVVEMEHWGVPFSRTPEGKIAQRPFGAGSYPRTCYAADRTGHVLLHSLYENCVRRNLKVYAEWVALELIVQDGACVGVVAMDTVTGAVESFLGKATVIATGGYGRTYQKTTNAMINTGAGMALAYAAGVGLKDMEFVQFHPTTLYPTNILITEAARGEGGWLINAQGERFMERYAKAMELAPRDIVSRSIQTEILEGRGFENAYVHLDLRHLGKAKLRERLPGVLELARDFAGVDAVKRPIPVQPGQHYAMGGIDCNVDGQTEMPGLYAAGECACVSVHGANRLGGNSLLETLVIGYRAGRAASQYVAGARWPGEYEQAAQQAQSGVESRIRALLSSDGPEQPARLREELQQIMDDKLGIFRNEADMRDACAQIRTLVDRCRKIRLSYRGNRFNLDLIRALQLSSMIEVAEAIAVAALARQESRGSHSRRDFPERDDVSWLCHSVAHRTDEGPKLSTKPVTITKWQPEARKY